MSDDLPHGRPSPDPGKPADDLADVWQVLDALPGASTPLDLTATTVELVAARAAHDTARIAPVPSSRTRRLWPLAAVVAGLVAGVVTGRATAPDPDRRVLEQLPLIEHLGLLQEAGSVEFLEQLARRMAAGQGPSARWFGFSRDAESLRAEAREFDAAIESLQAQLAASQSDRGPLASRRERVAGLADAELAALEKSAVTFEGLAAVDRRGLARLAQALADPEATALHEAARLWHVIVSATNPAFRRNVIEMATAERLEWLARGTGRFEPRLPSRSREEERGDRRPVGPRPDGEDRGWNGRQPPFPRPGTGFPGAGPPGPQPGWPAFRGSPPPRPAAAPEAPAETPAPPG